MWETRSHDLSDIKFDITNKSGTRIRTVFCRNKKFIYQTPHWLCDPSTFEELFNFLKPYFDKYVKEYENYKIFRSPITNSIFRMVLFYSKDTIPTDFRHGKVLYEIEIDNINKNKIKYEYKNTNLIENDKEKILSFYTNIEIELYNENSFFQYDGEKDPRIEDLCIICKRNKPNVLITKCFHLVTCTDCHRLNSLYCCPYCHKSFVDIHKVHFTVSGK